MIRILKTIFPKKRPSIEPEPFPGFPVPVSKLSAFAYREEHFIIALKDRTIIHHQCIEHVAFYNWLVEHKVRDISKDVLKRPVVKHQ
ncbi:MAG: hypothetical protein JSU01_09690 [Bacteroidetes bacterium]|nr:hypothetical protein [Bacteroidota bacterium]